jgi:hypothetical protein
METREDGPVETPKPDETQQGEGFWTRVKSAFGGENKPEPAPGSALPARTPRAPMPRRPKKTAFERAEERKKRLESLSAERRDRLASSVNKKVERTIVEKLEPREEAIGKVAAGFENLNDLLHGIGRTLTSQDESTRAIAERLLDLPGAVARIPETAAASREKLEEIARELHEQKGASRAMQLSLESVPDLLAVARQGTGTAALELSVMRDVHRELELQREQRERLLEEVGRVERALAVVAERIESAAKADRDERSDERADRARLERAVGLVVARIEEQSHRLEDVERDRRASAGQDVAKLERALGHVASRIDARATSEESSSVRVERALGVVACGVAEQIEAAREGARAQADASDAFRETRRAILATFDETQSRTVEALRLMADEHRRETDRRARRSVFATAAAAIATGVAGAALAVAVLFFQPQPTAPVVILPARPATLPARNDAATTLVAGFVKKPARADVAPITTAAIDVAPITTSRAAISMLPRISLK